jgi:hypothetical protein
MFNKLSGSYLHSCQTLRKLLNVEVIVREVREILRLWDLFAGNANFRSKKCHRPTLISAVYPKFQSFWIFTDCEAKRIASSSLSVFTTHRNGIRLQHFLSDTFSGNDSLLRELSYTGRELHADEALRFGLISRIFDSPKDVQDAARKLAQEISTKSPIALIGIKRVLNYCRDHSVSVSLRTISWLHHWTLLPTSDNDKLRNHRE